MTHIDTSILERELWAELEVRTRALQESGIRDIECQRLRGWIDDPILYDHCRRYDELITLLYPCS